MDITVERRGPIAVVTYDRPPVNLLSYEGFVDIAETFHQLGEDRSVRVVVFTAAGVRAFMGGADLKGKLGVSRGESSSPASYATDSGRLAREALWSLYDCAVPVVTAVNGPALGGGLGFVAVSDFVVAAEHARFGMTEIDVGILGGGAHLERLLGPVRARKMFFTGRQASAQEFFELGIVDAVVPVDELLPAALEIAENLAAKSPIAMRLAKESMNRIETMPIKDAYRIEQDYTRRLVQFHDSAEARAAFFEKREPHWRWE
jgi:enoyl-CoA hydratase